MFVIQAQVFSLFHNCVFILSRKQGSDSSSDSGSDSDSDSELIGPPLPPQHAAQDDDDELVGPPLPPDYTGSTAHSDDDDEEGEAQDDDDDDVCLIQ